jgi:ubiquinone/menaquinone biosynthesis C-methylase UbiE
MENLKMTSPVNERELSVLNVGGNSKTIAIPECFNGWRHDLLDIDSFGNPDVLCDARELWKLPPRRYDAIYCSHNLEHYYQHDVIKVLKGFMMVLKKGGFAYIMVPDLLEVMKTVVEKGIGFEDILYVAPTGPIIVRDVFYGYQKQIEKSGNDFYAHKTGFTEDTLTKLLMQNGFQYVFSDTDNFEIMALAFVNKPTQQQARLLNIKL